jgi:hypothetical protein
MGQADLPAARPGHTGVVAPRIALGIESALMVLALVLALGATACSRKEAPAPPPVIPPPPARPSEFVHPPIPSEPVIKPARAECSAEAVQVIAGRVGEVARRAARALDLRRPAARREGCGSPVMAQIDHEIKGPLLDRIRGCVAQDETFDPEWNLLDTAMISLTTCADCARAAAGRRPECQRVTDLVRQAVEGAKKSAAAR